MAYFHIILWDGYRGENLRASELNRRLATFRTVQLYAGGIGTLDKNVKNRMVGKTCDLRHIIINIV